MDPYLEDLGNWFDFHATFINYCSEALRAVLPAHYRARIGERLAGPTQPPATATMPLIVLEEARETYIEILHRPDQSLVAMLELLSPANKEELGRGAYLAKRNALHVQQVHLVELDLLLGGKRLPLRAPLPPADYFAFVARAERRPDCEVYFWNLPDRLPALPIPLRLPDPDVWLDLAAVFTLVYEKGGYRREIDYALPPPVPMSEDTQRWIAACIETAQAP